MRDPQVRLERPGRLGRRERRALRDRWGRPDRKAVREWPGRRGRREYRVRLERLGHRDPWERQESKDLQERKE
jgi:hypothetical protein